MLSARKDIETAIEAMRLGAYHYASKELDLDSVPALVAGAVVRQDLNRHVLQLSGEWPSATSASSSSARAAARAR